MIFRNVEKYPPNGTSSHAESLNRQLHNCKILTLRENSSAKRDILLLLAVSRDVGSASRDKRDGSGSDSHCSHSVTPKAVSSLYCSLAAPFCACAADLTSEIISSMCCPTRPLYVMNALLCLLKLLFFNASVCQPEYIVQLGLLPDSTAI
jgi:hypothetical protein